MTDDIVTRLRDRAQERQEALDDYWNGHKFDYDPPMLESQAADEIEHLRAEVDKWRKIAKERNPHSWRNLVQKRYGIEDMYD